MIVLITNISIFCVLYYNFFYFSIIVPITLVPNAGHYLGGTAVRVAGACLDQRDSITCIFADTEVEGIFINERLALCVSPQIPLFGRVPFELIVRDSFGLEKARGKTNFFLRKLLTISTYNSD